MKIITIDCDYVSPRFAASFLLVQDGEAAFVETNTANAVPKLISSLKKEGLTPAQVKYVIITHSHLDHAGGAGLLMNECASATLLAHPRAARHAIDPSKLAAGAREVYGEEVFSQLYGRIEPVPANRVRSMEDGEKLSWKGADFLFFHTRGHANHHFCVFEKNTRSVFTGDSFGLMYPDLQKGKRFVFPSTSPTGFDPIAARESFGKIVSTGAQTAYLTHFGPIDDLSSAAAQLSEHMDFSERIFKEMRARKEPIEELEAEVFERLREYYEHWYRKNSYSLNDADWAILELDLQLNAQGILYSAKNEARV